MAQHTPTRYLALARGPDGISFALLSANGRVQQRGAFPRDAPHRAALVVADYSLLQVAQILEYAATEGIGLAPPDPLGDAENIARQWRRLPESERARLSAAELRQLAPLLEARSIQTVAMQQILDRVRSHLATVSPEYLDILSEHGRLLPRLLPILRDYPTPERLRAAGLIQLTRALQAALPSGQAQVLDRVLRFGQSNTEPALPPLTAWIAETVLPADIDVYLAVAEQRAGIDRRMHEFARHGPAWPAADLAPGPLSPPAPPEAAARGVERGDDRGVDPRALRDRVAGLLRDRCSRERNAGAAFEEYRRIRAAIDAADTAATAATAEAAAGTAAEAPLGAKDAIRLEIAGQLLALSAGSCLDAMRHRGACEELLRELPEGVGGRKARRLRADAGIAIALTEACAVDVVSGLAALGRAVEGPRAEDASPELLCEALGAIALVLVLLGEHRNHPQALSAMRAAVAEHDVAGPARAPGDIAELFLAGGRPDFCPAALGTLRELADEHSRGTAYRSYFHYVSMLVACATRDPEAGIAAFAGIVEENIWPRYQPRLYALARLSHATLLSARGDFAWARRELDAIPRLPAEVFEGGDPLIKEFLSLRLDLAVGRHQHVLAATAPGGPFGEDRVTGPHLRRYLHLALLLRGTALWREGERELAAECFLRVTGLAAAAEEWYAILSWETPEYRGWLEGLDGPDGGDGRRLPDGLDPAIRDAVLGKPILISHALPQLTPQQLRILHLLALGRSSTSIAAELHITGNTIKSHLRRLYGRLGVNSRDQAVLRAEAYGLLK